MEQEPKIEKHVIGEVYAQCKRIDELLKKQK